MIDQILDMLLAFFVVNLGAIVEETAVALREGVLVQVVVPVYPCLGDLKNFAVHNLNF